jgi:NADH:ubiquinone oxidoreductase subunit 6 (subunit J)
MTIAATDTTGARSRLLTLRRGSPTIVYAGVVVILIGFVLILFAWARVAGLDSVPQQLPYVLSGGIVGLGLILCGLTAVNVGALHAAEAERARQLDRLANLVETLTTDSDER